MTSSSLLWFSDRSSEDEKNQNDFLQNVKMVKLIDVIYVLISKFAF